MIAVVQRVRNTSLSVEGKLISQIEKGFAVYLGVANGDSERDLDYIVKKVTKLRVFEDENGKMNLDLASIGGEVLLISQFTLLADTRHGNRPSFIKAMAPEEAAKMYDLALEKFNAAGITTKPGVFGADMKIEQFNDGPVTIIINSREQN